MADEWTTRITQAQIILNYTFRNPNLLVEALLAPGANALLPRGNKRLAVVGDAAAALALVEEWFRDGREPKIWDIFRNRELTNIALAPLCDRAGLTKHIVGNASQQGAVSSGTKADTIEAVIGAIYLDSNRDIDAVRDVMRTLGVDFDASTA